MQTRPFASSGLRLARRIALPLLAVSAMGLAALPGRAATLLEYWDFNNDSQTFSGSTFGSLTTSTTTSVTTGAGNGEIYNTASKLLTSNSANGAVFTNGTLDLNGLIATHGANAGVTGTSPAWGVYTDSSTNRLGTDTSTGGSIALVNSAANDLDSLVFTLSSTGYSSLTLSSAQRFGFSSTSGLTITWSYSTDGGTTWQTAGITTTGSYGVSGAFSALSVNLPTTLGNLSSFQVKESIQFGASQSSFAIDNVQLTGTAVPEPATVALLAAGGVLVFWRLRRRAALA